MPVLFTMCTVNSYGSAEIDHLKDDGKPLNISRKYISYYRSLFVVESTSMLIEKGFPNKLDDTE